MLSKIFYFLQLMPKSNNHNLVHEQVKETTAKQRRKALYTTPTNQPPTHNSNFQPGRLQSYPKETKFEVTDDDEGDGGGVVWNVPLEGTKYMFRFVLDDKKLTSSLKEKQQHKHILQKHTVCVWC